MAVAPMTRPQKTILRPSRFCNRAPIISMVISVAIPPGASTIPASVAEYPISVWRKSGINVIELYRQKPTTNMMKLPAENEMFLKSRRLMIGCSLVSSTHTSAIRETIVTILKAMMKEELNQSSCCPLSSTTCNPPMPVVSSSSPQ